MAGVGWYLDRHGLDAVGDLEPVLSALGVLSGLTAVVLVALRFGRPEPAPVSLEEVADALAAGCAGSGRPRLGYAA